MRRAFAVLSFIVLGGCAYIVPPAPGPVAAYPVFFQTWSAAIDPTAATTIATAAKAALASPDARVRVTGAADTVGSAKANQYLSRTRAQVVADALAEDGVDPSRIRVKAIGEQNAPGGVEGAPAQFSRRVLIEIRE
jgi:outer membrane protein OmpA-like peptidoglycan-associated protein